MHTTWSTYVQSIGTLYNSRRLRFADRYQAMYTNAFQLPSRESLSILEIGCGPGALCQALHRWYPTAQITGLDRDSRFVEFAAAEMPEIRFVEGDATALPFPDASFDVTISYTVMEHIPPEVFLREQYRVLKPGGVCLVLSVRPGRVSWQAPCLTEYTDLEKEIFARMKGDSQDYNKLHGVCQYPRTEQEMPILMEAAGFSQVSTDYLTVNLTPDNPENDRATAHAMILSGRQTALDSLDCMERMHPGVVSQTELAEMKRLTAARYDKRLALYDAGVHQWDVYLCLTMVMRGVK